MWILLLEICIFLIGFNLGRKWEQDKYPRDVLHGKDAEEFL